MTRNLIGAALAAALLATAAPARAESEWVKIFDVEGDPKTARFEVAVVTKLCDFHMMSRMGPDPREVAACEGAMKRLSARGAKAAPAIMAAIDREETPHGARTRLYAALAATGERAVAERMIDALGKIATTDEAQLRDHEAHDLEATAEAILRAAPEERAPWVKTDVTARDRRWTNRVFAWRALLREHPGATPAEIEAAHVARARGDLESPDLERAFIAARYLVDRDPAAGLRGAEALAKRVDEVPEDAREIARRTIDSLRRNAEHRMRAAEERAAEREPIDRKKYEATPAAKKRMERYRVPAPPPPTAAPPGPKAPPADRS